VAKEIRSQEEATKMTLEVIRQRVERLILEDVMDNWVYYVDKEGNVVLDEDDIFTRHFDYLVLKKSFYPVVFYSEAYDEVYEKVLPFINVLKKNIKECWYRAQAATESWEGEPWTP
jgi:hypothetical protein